MDLMTHARIVLLATLLGLASCGGDQPAPAKPSGDDGGGTDEAPLEIAVTEAQSGGSTALQIGQILRVELPANPATGCAWQVDSVDESILRMPAMEEYLPPHADSLEEAGTSIWRLTARASGQTTVKLRYVCLSTDDLNRPEPTFTFKVIVD